MQLIAGAGLVRDEHEALVPCFAPDEIDGDEATANGASREDRDLDSVPLAKACVGWYIGQGIPKGGPGHGSG